MSQPITHRLVATPNPQVIALRVDVRQDALVSDPTILPAEGALYRDFPGKILSKDWLAKFGDYKYVNCDNGKPSSPNPDGRPPGVERTGGIDGNATLSLLFLPTLSQEQRDTAYRTTSSFGNHRWAPILERLDFFADTNFPRATNRMIGGRGAVVTGPSYYVRENYRPECNEGSRFTIEEFFSDVPYAVPPYLVPVPRSVSYDVPGARGSFPECLGPDIDIPPFQTANLAFFTGNANAVNANGSIGGQFFPKTNFQRWSPYVVSDQTHFDNGYVRTRIKVWPPLVANRLITQ